MTLEELELDHYFTPQDKLEYVEFQKITTKFCSICKNREQKDLSTKEIFELISDNKFYQETYKQMISENNTREALRIFLSTDLSMLEDRKTIQIAKSWRLL